ncbi:LamG-like jellyroll fold domain-containing protein [Streptomyces sp. NPDC006458]|uniref:LamG-like jellyroll fold domain-containing protein n=1 Tax=Streptomyces sp. NPDC006458 TaxID=3154302 RepID=UPI0033B954B9
MADGPPITVEVAFDGGPNADTYTWTDVTPWVSGFGIKRGRNSELDRIEAGTLSLALDNSDGRFTPMRNASVELLPPNVTTGSDTLGTTAGFNGIVVSNTSSNTHSGARAIQSVGSTLSSGTAVVYTDRIPVRPGNKYQGSFWVRNAVDAVTALPGRCVIRWRDAAGNFISDSIGTAWTGVPTSWSQLSATGVAPPNAAFGILILENTSAATGAWSIWSDDFSLAEVSPYWPNVLPRRRVRVRTANLLPKDVSTGGDISRSADMFTGGQSGVSAAFELTPKSGTGSIRVNLASNGAADFASSVYCGFVKTIADDRRWWSTTKLVPTGLAKVVGGAVYTASGQLRLGAGSGALGVKCRIRWYTAASALISTSAATAAVALNAGGWSSFAVTATAPSAAAWAGIEIGSSGGDGGAWFLADELQLEAGTAVTPCTPGGSIFSGFIEKWPVKVDSMSSSIELPATDAFLVLGEAELRSPYQQAALASQPVGYWTLGDASGAARVENLADDTKPAAVRASKYGSGTPQFGAASLVLRDSETTSYNLANVASDKGSVIDLNDLGRRKYALGTELTVAFWTLPTRPAAGNMVTLFAAWDDAARRLISFRLTSDGYLQVETGFADGSSTYLDTVDLDVKLSTSKASFIVAYVQNGETMLYVNGSSVGYSLNHGPAPTTTDLRDMRWSSVAGQQAGSIYKEYANGRFGHVALWDRRLNASEITELWAVGDNGGAVFSESEAARVLRIARYGSFAGEVVTDAGMSTVLSPSWSEGSTALEEVQLAAADGGGYAFMDGDGRLTFHNRARRQSAPLRYVLSDTAGTPFEPGLEFDMDGDQVVNEVAYKRPEGVESTLRDNTSISTYGRKSRSIELRVTDDSAVVDAAYAMLSSYANPIVRCDQVVIKPTATPALFSVMLGIEIGDRITLADLPNAAPASSFNFYVEAIDIQVDANGTAPIWVATLSLSPASATDVFVLGDSPLDGSFGLAY